MKNIHFTKMEAFGNDYIYIDAIKQDLPEDLGSLSKALSDRHYGVGGDGMVLLWPSDKGAFMMRIFNPDGTEAEMCGNAIRSSSMLFYTLGYTKDSAFTVETLGGMKDLNLDIENDRVVNVRAMIGKPVFDPEKIVVLHKDGDFLDIPVDIKGHTYKMSSLSWGNPHTAIFVDDVDTFDVTGIGPLVENAPIFPNRTNVTFVQVVDDKNLKIREWERGCGETIGCATGCCTAMVFAHRLGHTGRDVRVTQIGGVLETLWDEEGNVHMKGPARIVFEGDYPYEW